MRQFIEIMRLKYEAKLSNEKVARACGVSKCAALELAPYNIRVAAVAPGRVDTPMLRQYEALGLWEHIRREHMRNEFTQPAEIADVFAFLASTESNCINGCTVSAEDGFSNFKYPLLPRE